MDNIRFFGVPNLHVHKRPESPIGILFLTSVRDVGECDQNGLHISTKHGLAYMEGLIERTVRATYRGEPLYGLLKVCGVVTDDTVRDLARSVYPRLPAPGRPWIHPHTLAREDSTLISADTWNIPSTFRALPKTDIAGRARRKREFECQVLQRMNELGAHILISDHYMARIEYLISDLGLFGKVLNIHPAITLHGHPFCFRGKTPTQDAIDSARSGTELVRTGATLHFVDSEIDHGAPIAYTEATVVSSQDTPEVLRQRNYRQAKLPLFVHGMRHYIESLLPLVGKSDFSTTVPLEG